MHDLRLISFIKQADLPVLEELVFVGNPLEEKETAEGTYRDNVAKKLPKLKKLDGKIPSLNLFTSPYDMNEND